MSEREYVVVVNKGVNLAELEAELTASSGSGPIPNRSVPIADARIGSTRMTHFMLTAEEATELMEDDRVLSVEIPVGERTDIQIGHNLTQGGSNFRRTTVHANTDINWGLIRCSNTSNTVYANNVAPSVDYTTGIGGRGVDVVIQDSGIQADHPDFFDRNGVTRVQQIDWYTASGITGTQDSNFYEDYDGHGTHCASIAAGLKYGWAKASHIYAQKLAGLEGDTDPGSGIPIGSAFDAIRLWHNAKTNGRPTVVNMSWGYSANISTDPSSGNYRGNAWVWNPPEFVEGYDSRSGLWSATGVVDNLFGSGTFMIMPVRVASVDAEIDDMIAAGIHVVIAAGNNIYKHDVPGGDDYDNTVVFGGTTYNYHRGSSPHSDDAGTYVVGNIDYHTEELIGPTGTDIITDSSSRGPAVNMLAPGQEIMAATSTTNRFTDFDYPENTNFKLTAIGGTSMAAPQVAGVIAQHLELFPTITPAQMQTRINADAIIDTVYTTGQDSDYNSYQNSLMGTPNRMLYSKYNQQPLSFAGFALTTGASSATYALEADVTNVNEGDTVTFTLTTSGLGDGVTIAYAISGIQSSDLSAGALSGSFTITSNTATAAFTLANDLTTEGAETLTLTLLNGQASQAVTVNDTSVTPPAATYTLSSDVPNVNEGDTVTFTLTTTQITNGTLIPYTITGVTSADIGGASLTGNFTITNNTDTLAITFAEDSTTEGAETIRLSLDNGQDFHDVTVNDTSQTPVTPDPTYTLSGPTSANEGDTITVTLTTTNVDDATEVAYSVTGTINSDFTSGTALGNFTVNNNTAQVSWTLAADLSTEGTEVMLVSLDNGEDTHTINIQDTSRTPVYTNLLNDSGNGSINEGETVTFTLQGADIPENTTVPYTITGISNPGDTDTPLSGNLTMTANSASLAVTLKEDTTTEGAETLTFTLGATDSNGTSTGALSVNINIVDTSVTFVPDYTITVENSGNNYLLSGTDRSGSFASASQPALTFNTGDKVQFVINAGTASSHPFYIKTVQGTGPGNQASGTTGQGTQQLNWTIASTGTYYYQCSIHNNMNNTITVNT